MRVITEERLRELSKTIGADSICAIFIKQVLLAECTELNPWQPIETAPKDRPIMLFYPGYMPVNVPYFNPGETDLLPTHWQELPEDPK